MFNDLRYSINRIRFKNPDKFVEHLYKMKREDVSLPFRMPLCGGGIVMLPINQDIPWPPEPNSDFDKEIRRRVLLVNNPFIIS